MSVLWEMRSQDVVSRSGDVPRPSRSPDLSGGVYLKSRVFNSKPRTTAELKQKHEGRNRGDPGADNSLGDGKSWCKAEVVLEKWWETFE